MGEVPGYGGSVDGQRMYQTYQAAAPTVQTYQAPVSVSTLSGMSAEQLKFIFPHGAPVNYAPAPAIPSSEVVAASTVVEAVAPQVTSASAVVEEVQPASTKKSSKKSSKKKMSSKKKAKGGCC